MLAMTGCLPGRIRVGSDGGSGDDVAMPIDEAQPDAAVPDAMTADDACDACGACGSQGGPCCEGNRMRQRSGVHERRVRAVRRARAGVLQRSTFGMRSGQRVWQRDLHCLRRTRSVLLRPGRDVQRGQRLLRRYVHRVRTTRSALLREPDLLGRRDLQRRCDLSVTAATAA